MRHDILEATDRAGINILQAEFHPAKEISQGIDAKSNIILNDINTIYTTGKTNNNFVNWFENICSSIGHNVHLIPDTNFFRRYYYSNFFKQILLTNERLSIKIPRLVILEIENKYNKSSHSKSEQYNGDIKNNKKERAEDDNNKIIKTYNRLKEKRLSLYTIREILIMKREGAEVLPEPEIPLLESFSRAAGTGFADHWIRREISEYAKRQTAVFERDKSGNVVNADRPVIVFITSDIMNALVANSEGLTTIYFSRKEDDIINLGFGEYTKLAKLIFNTAIQFGECNCIIKYNNKIEKFRLIGMWNGKSTYDWQNDFLMKDNS
jgi:hypothetical protein